MANKTDSIFLTIIMPALNEEKNISSSIDDTLSAFGEFGIKGEIVVINDGSSDTTPNIIQRKMEENPEKVRMINHNKPKGLGASFWDGVDNAKGNIVCMLPGDNENEPGEIFRYIYLLENVDIVIPFVFNKGTRSFFRNFISFVYKLVINNTFFVSLNYTNGTVLYRKSLLSEMEHRNSGFFYQTDILIRLIKRKYLFAEVPYRLKLRKEGKSKALSFHSFYKVIKGFFLLFTHIYFKKERQTINPDSVSAKRYQALNKG
ncbi:MAG: glycosyltransferase family 2 protein [Elusimicrobiota bacterium]